MPQASKELRDEWADDTEALEYLESQGVKMVSYGLLAVTQSQDTGRVKSAIDYLIDEWDFDATTIPETVSEV